MTDRRKFLSQAVIGMGGTMLARSALFAEGCCAAAVAAASVQKTDAFLEAAKRFPHFHSHPVSYQRIKMTDAFWAPRQQITHAVTLPWVTRAHDSAGGLAAYRKDPERYMAQTRLGEMEHIKCLEAMATVAGRKPDPALNGLIEAWAKPLIAGQGADGYLAASFPRGINHPSQRWQAAWWSHEDYTLGHYLEAAIAFREATGRETLYRSAVRAVDHMAAALANGQHAYTSGHPEIEQALMRLYGLTGEAQYLRLCGELLEQRGQHAGRPSYGRYGQDHLPIKAQRTIEGHAVRAAFLFNGATQYVGATGDAGYREAVLALWQDLVERKLYLHGAAGNLSARNEGYRRNPYCLLPDDVYGESCAVMANFQWAHSLARLTGEAHYLDTAERLLYNAFSAALSLEGDRSFYCNVAQTDPRDELSKSVHYPHTRSPQQATGCCPPNIVKLINKIGGYFYSTDPEGIYVNHYGACEASVPWGRGVELIQRTRFPWDGGIELEVRPRRPQSFTLRLRLPEWAPSYQLAVNGKALKIDPQQGWLAVRREWRSGDRIELTLPMSIERVRMPQQFNGYENRVALRRGPIVYCLEAQDLESAPLGGSLSSFYLPQEAPLTSEHRPDFLGGVTVLKAEVRQVIGEFEYEREQAQRAMFVPYAVWGNRTAGAMRIWLAAHKASAVDLITPQTESGESCIS